MTFFSPALILKLDTIVSRQDGGVSMSISSINSYGTGYDNLASGYRITTAADDPAGSAISEKLEAGSKGYDAGSKNAATGQDMLNVSDGALGSITDSLQRIRELSVQASNNAVYNKDDVQAMQDEVDQLKKQIQDTAKGTEFNTKKLLDGSASNVHIASNPDGSGMKLNTGDSTLEALGIKDFDLTKDFDISTIDKAIKKVNEMRGSNGAASNALSYQIDYSNSASFNLTNSQSKIKDQDMAQGVSEMQKDKVLQEYRLFAQKQQAQSQLSLQKMFL